MQKIYQETQSRVGPRNPSIYRGSRLWEFNVHGAIIAGFSGGIFLVVVAVLVVWNFSPNLSSALLLTFILANSIVGVLALYRGNLIALFPYAVEVGPCIVLFAPYKRIKIPFEQVRDVRNSFLHQGFVVRLRQRQGLLNYFVIHWFFGPERQALAEAIRKAIEQHQATSLSVGRRE